MKLLLWRKHRDSISLILAPVCHFFGVSTATALAPLSRLYVECNFTPSCQPHPLACKRTYVQKYFSFFAGAVTRRILLSAYSPEAFDCSWGSCGASFDSQAARAIHLKDHISTERENACRWRNCEVSWAGR